MALNFPIFYVKISKLHNNEKNSSFENTTDYYKWIRINKQSLWKKITFQSNKYKSYYPDFIKFLKNENKICSLYKSVKISKFKSAKTVET